MNVYQRKSNEICQGFLKAVISGTRSGSGKIIYEHFEKLKQIWGGLPNIEYVPNGVDSDFVNFNVSAGNMNFMSSVEGDKIETTASNTISVSNNDDENTSGVINHEKLISQMTNNVNNKFENEENQKSSNEKEDHVTRLIHENRRHLEHRLSASQRDTFLIKGAKKDCLEKKESREILKCYAKL